MRTTFVNTLIDLMRKNPRILVLTADMGYGVFEELQKEFPDRFVNTGVAEANTASMAAGLALSGYTVVFYAQASFASMRAFEQVRLDIASHNLNVKIFGTSSGLNLSQYGISHHAIEDVSIMRTLPNMKVFSPGDLWEAELVTRAVFSISGPTYVRIGKTNKDKDIELHSSKPKFKIGKAIKMSDGKDGIIFATGSMLFTAKEVVGLLKKKGKKLALISIPTIKPIDASIITSTSDRPIFTLEEHTIIGGLGSAVAEVIAENGSGRLIRLGIPDKYLHIVGSREYLLDRYGLSSRKIVSRIIKKLKDFNEI